MVKIVQEKIREPKLTRKQWNELHQQWVKARFLGLSARMPTWQSYIVECTDNQDAVKVFFQAGRVHFVSIDKGEKHSLDLFNTDLERANAHFAGFYSTINSAI